jgi:hypothetical protein
MIPSTFIILDKLPLNANGKIDRKLLSSPNLSSLQLSSLSESNTSNNELEEHVQEVRCQILRFIGRQIPTAANFFSIRGHSLLFIQLYHHYQSVFDFDNDALLLTLFLQHSQLLQTMILNHSVIDLEKYLLISPSFCRLSQKQREKIERFLLFRF